MNSESLSTAFLFLLILSATSVLVLAWQVWVRRAAPAASMSTLLLLSIALWAAGYAMELTRSGEIPRQIWFDIRFLAVVLVSHFYYISAYQLAHDGEPPGGPTLAALAAIGLAEIAFIWTNPLHHLFIADLGPQRILGFGALSGSLRIGFWGFLLISYSLLACGTIDLLLGAPRFSHPYRGQVAAIAVAALIPWAASILYFLGLSPFAKLDPVPVTFTLSALLYGWAFHRFQLFDIIPVSHDRVVRSMPDAVVVLDGRDRVVDLNPAAQEMLGLIVDRTMGREAQDVLAAWPKLLQRYRAGAETRTEISLEWGQQKRYLELQVSPLVRSRRGGIGRVLVAHDVTERRRMEEALRYSSLHDRLTGLPNRSFLLTRLKSALARSRRRPDSCFAVLFLDLDRFKIVNDNLGHFLGDQLLIAVSEKLLSCVREPDTVARLGGDEFVILLEEIQNEEDAVKVVRRIQETLSAPFNLSGHEIYTTASIGVAVATPRYSHVDDILHDADVAMYQAKTGGRSRFAVFLPGMEMRATDFSRLEAELRQALERGELALRYQPIYCLETGAPVGVEALLRWEHPQRGTVLPAQFLDAAEEAGLMVPIGLRGLRTACRQLAAWQKRFPRRPPLYLGFNVSDAELANPELAAAVCTTLEDSGVPPQSLVLEISEPVLLRTIERNLPVLLHLHELGVPLAVDDFGAGYCSFSLLHDLPIETLKIERSVVQRFLDGEGDPQALRSLFGFGRSLKKRMVVERIETPQELRRLTELRCAYGQGYYLAKPLSVREAEDLLCGSAGR